MPKYDGARRSRPCQVYGWPLPVPMLMMNVGVVRVIVCNPHVCVPMRVRLVPIPRKFVRMLMVLIMYMAVRMGYGVVRMYVFMTFRSEGRRVGKECGSTCRSGW